MKYETPIPASRLQQVRNTTPFPHLRFDKMGKGRRFHDVVVVCASFVLDSGRLKPAAVHRGPVIADRLWHPDAAAVSSLQCATDVLLIKPGSDVYVTGTVRPLDARPCREWHGLLRVERDGLPLIHKILRFTGPRRWQRSLLGWSLTVPEATMAVPLRYELAYGGWWYDKGDAMDAAARVCEENPSGTGWFGTADRRHHPRARYAHGQAVAGPQIEYADSPIHSDNRRHRVAGFGPVARHWMPRHRHAGSYDAAWLAQFQHEEIPDYPADFDYRYFHYAPEDQVIGAGLIGDEDLMLAGVFAEVPGVSARLPHLWMEAVCHRSGDEPLSQAMRLDTVHVDLDAMLVHLTWRLVLGYDQEIVRVELFDRLIANGRCTRTAFRGIRS
ncbi:hypothetical protein DFR29_1162 [Tahibacter aquaticus]|uniref:DUF2169 domain-containing protein n=1 Tax=Tahibacter aquaticus TaxID=520092 RepID=A0A4R6YNR2_9GAMM|nr:DUF2169 domain-containing protein [Tahibacter aquaticus]TDR39313.1 hypothetical protein DFR29_1162 [Tahibacter aquaticus]